MKFTSARSPSFTLIELLIVIVIIGILAGVVLSVLNPAKIQRRSAESVLRANTEKMCLALAACTASTVDYTNCNSLEKIGVTLDDADDGSDPYDYAEIGWAPGEATTEGIPPYGRYYMTRSGSNIYMYGILYSGQGLGGGAAAGHCYYRCYYVSTTKQMTDMYKYVASGWNCLID